MASKVALVVQNSLRDIVASQSILLSFFTDSKDFVVKLYFWRLPSKDRNMLLRDHSSGMICTGASKSISSGYHKFRTKYIMSSNDIHYCDKTT